MWADDQRREEVTVSVNWRLPWEDVFFNDSLPEHTANIDEAIYEWVLWHDPDEWSEEFMAFVRCWDIDLGDLEEFALNHSKLPSVRQKVYR